MSIKEVDFIMIEIKKIVITVGVIALVLWLSVKIHWAASLIARAHTLGNVISCYIANEGYFPSSEDDLVQRGYLRKENNDVNSIQYYIRCDPNTEGWHSLFPYKLFKIRYGIDIQDLKIINGKVCDKITNEPILLIEGSYSFALKRTYESVTLMWYNQVLKKE